MKPSHRWSAGVGPLFLCIALFTIPLHGQNGGTGTAIGEWPTSSPMVAPLLSAGSRAS